MDRDDFLGLFEGLAGDTQLDARTGKTSKDWIGWLCVSLAILLIGIAFGAIIFALLG